MRFANSRSSRSRFGRKLLAILSLCLAAFFLFFLILWGNPLYWPYKVTEWASWALLKGPVRVWWGPLVRTAHVYKNAAYIGLGTEMGVLDIHDPAHPKLLEKQYIGGIAHGFCQSGTTMFLAAGPSGLTSFDVSDPLHPRKLDRFSNMGYGMHCALEKDLLLFSNEMAGWTLLDVSDPADLKPLTSVDGGWVSAAKIVGTVAYILDGRRGLDVYDIADPKSPHRIGNLPVQLPEEIYEPDPPPIWMEIRDNFAYLSNGSDGLRIVDVTDPKTPRPVSHVPLPGYTYTVALRGDQAWLANINLGLVIVDITEPRHPTVLKTCATPGGAYDIIFRENIGFVSDGANGFLIFDAAAADSPQTLGYYQVPPASRRVTVAGKILAVANESAGFSLYDISTPGSPKFLSATDTKGLTARVAIRGNRAIIADVLGGASVFDIGDPTAPRPLGIFIPEDHPWDIAIDGDYGYLAYGHHGFGVLDLRPDIPKHLANEYSRLGSDFGYLISVAKEGPIAVAADLVNGLFIYDVGDPARPIRKAVFPPPSNPLFFFLRHGTILRPVIGVALHDSRAYLAAANRGLTVVNYRDPGKPFQEASYSTEGSAYGVAFTEDKQRLGLAEYEGKLSLLDVAELSKIKAIRSWQLDGELHHLQIAGDYAYIAAGSRGVAVVDLSGDRVTYLPIVTPTFQALACEP